MKYLQWILFSCPNLTDTKRWEKQEGALQFTERGHRSYGDEEGIQSFSEGEGLKEVKESFPNSLRREGSKNEHEKIKVKQKAGHQSSFLSPKQ